MIKNQEIRIKKFKMRLKEIEPYMILTLPTKAYILLIKTPKGSFKKNSKTLK